MGFDVFGPTRHVRASTTDDRGVDAYDLFTLANRLGLKCPQLERLNERFYETTVLKFAFGEVAVLRDELESLQQAYRQHLEPILMRERGVRAGNPEVRAAIMERVLQEDAAYAALVEFRVLCEEAIAAQADVRCEGD